MFKKEITYSDYNGEERTESFYFNLSKAELMEMNFSVDGGLQQRIEKIIAARDTVQISELFKKIIKDSYGRPSDDGKGFIKKVQDKYGNPYRLFDDFEQTEAYSELYMELVSDDKAASEFINSILPKIDTSK